MEFPYESSMKKHKTLYHKDYFCSFCENTFKSHMNMITHMKKEHPTIKYDLIKDKNGTGYTAVRYKIPVQRKRFTCDICNKKFTKKQIVKNHITRVHLGEKRYSCEICKKGFDRSGFLQFHMKSAHPNDVAY